MEFQTNKQTNKKQKTKFGLYNKSVNQKYEFVILYAHFSSTMVKTNAFFSCPFLCSKQFLENRKINAHVYYDNLAVSLVLTKTTHTVQHDSVNTYPRAHFQSQSVIWIDNNHINVMPIGKEVWCMPLVIHPKTDNFNTPSPPNPAQL